MARGKLGHCNWGWRDNACMGDAKGGIQLGLRPSCGGHEQGLFVYPTCGEEGNATASVRGVLEAGGMEQHNSTTCKREL